MLWHTFGTLFDYLLETGQNRIKIGVNRAFLKLFSGFKSNKRSHSGDNGFRVHLFPRRVKLRFKQAGGCLLASALCCRSSSRKSHGFAGALLEHRS